MSGTSRHTDPFLPDRFKKPIINMKNTKNRILARSIAVLAAGLMMAHGAPVTGVTYTYNNLGELVGVAGKDAPAGAAQALTDGIGQSGVYVPSNFFWEPGGEGTLYALTNNIGTTSQPSVTFDLGDLLELENVTIHYGVRQGSGIAAPASVDVSVDGNFVANFVGFDNSPNAVNFGDIRSNQIDLTGQAGQFVTLEFKGMGEFVGLTEVEFEGMIPSDDDPNLVVSSAINLGTVAKSPASNALSFEVRNTGATNTLDVTGLTFTGADAPAFAASALPTGIAAAGGMGTVNFTFDSGGVAGIYTATASLESNDPSSPATVNLTIAVEEGPILGAPASVDLGTISTVPGSTSGQFSISNSALATPLNISEVNFTGPDGSNFTVDSSPGILLPGESGDITFTFDSGGVDGFFSADCEIVSDDPASPTTLVPVSVNLEGGPALAVPSFVDLRAILVSSGTITRSVAISNSAFTNTLNISSVSFKNISGGATWTPANFPASLLPGAAGGITFTFDTEIGAGIYTADLEIASDDAFSPTVVNLEIEVVDPPIGANAYQQAVINDRPLLYWTFDESDDTDSAIELMVGDIVNDLTPQGGATRIASDIGLGNAADFDGVSGSRFYSSTLSAARSSYAQYAVEMWVRLDDAASASYLLEGASGVGAGGAGANSPAMIHGYNPNLEGFFGGGGRTGTSGPTVLSDNTWHHIVLSVDVVENSHSFYVDGDLVGTYPGSATWKLPVLGVGATQIDGTGAIRGQIDELAFYDLSGGLTGQDIADHFLALPEGPGGQMALVIDSYNPDTNELIVRVNNIPEGQDFHLRSSTDLVTFSAFSPGFSFDSTTTQPFVIDSAGAPKLFLRVFDGVSP